MNLKSEIHHPNDILVKFSQNVFPKEMFEYFKLSGKFVKNYPTVIIKRDGSERRMDWLILSRSDGDDEFGELLINVEFQSSAVDVDKLRAIADYKDYAKTYYGKPVLSVIIISEGYESSKKGYKISESEILKPHFIHMGWEELTERLNNLEEKIRGHEILSNDEALDIVFLPMFAPKCKAEFVTEKITRLLACDESLTGIFRNDVAQALSFMIIKYFDCTPKGKELLELIKQEIDNSRLRDVVDFEVDFIKKSLEAEIAERDGVIVEKDNLLDEKDNLLDEKDNLLDEKDDEIARLKAKLAENGIK